MKATNKSLLYISVISIVLAVLGSVLLFLGGANDFDADFGYFKTGSVYAAALYAVLAAGAVAGIIAWIINRKAFPESRALPRTAAMPVFAVVCGAAVAATSVSDAVSYMNSAPDTLAVIRFISWAFAVPATISVFLFGIGGKKEPNALSCLLGFFTPLYFASKVLADYFDRTTAVNSPVKILCQITFLAFMLLFTAEEGLSLGRKNIYPRYLFTLCAATVLGFAAGLGGFILYAAGYDFPISLENSFLCLCTALYAAGRLISCCSFPTEARTRAKEINTPEDTEEAEEAREE